MAAGALLHSLVHNHPFHNGNKRTALVSMLVFLDKNGLALKCNEDHLFVMVLQLAQHNLVEGPRNELPDRESLQIARWLKSNARLIETKDKSIKFHRLRKILGEYNCVFQSSPGAGSGMIITREFTKKNIFGINKKTFLQSHIHYGGEGREVPRSSIKKLRRELHLDPEHNVDSLAFYDKIEISPSDFIKKYSKTLRRLGRL